MLIVVATLRRVVPEIWPTRLLPAPPLTLVALMWAAGFLLWLKVYWPFLKSPETFQNDGCQATQE